MAERDEAAGAALAILEDPLGGMHSQSQCMGDQGGQQTLPDNARRDIQALQDQVSGAGVGHWHPWGMGGGE